MHSPGWSRVEVRLMKVRLRADKYKVGSGLRLGLTQGRFSF